MPLHTRLGGADPQQDRRLSGREIVVLSWAGTRGVISLAAIFTLPLVTDSGAPFPGRDLLLFCAYVIVLITLVGQGVTFVPVVRATGLRANDADAVRIRNQARAASVQAALSRVDQLAEDDDISTDLLAGPRADLNHRAQRYQRRIDYLDAAEEGDTPVCPSYEAALRARRAVVDAQRDELLRWRDAGRLPEESLRVLERELDHTEHTLRGR